MIISNAFEYINIKILKHALELGKLTLPLILPKIDTEILIKVEVIDANTISNANQMIEFLTMQDQDNYFTSYVCQLQAMLDQNITYDIDAIAHPEVKKNIVRIMLSCLNYQQLVTVKNSIMDGFIDINLIKSYICYRPVDTLLLLSDTQPNSTMLLENCIANYFETRFELQRSYEIVNFYTTLAEHLDDDYLLSRVSRKWGPWPGLRTDKISTLTVFDLIDYYEILAYQKANGKPIESNKAEFWPELAYGLGLTAARVNPITYSTDLFATQIITGYVNGGYHIANESFFRAEEQGYQIMMQKLLS